MKRKVQNLTRVSILACVVLLVVSCFVGEMIALPLLVLAFLAASEVVYASFWLKLSFDSKLWNLMLWALIVGRIMRLSDNVWVAAVFYWAVLVLGCVALVRFLWYMNTYCDRDAEEMLDK